MRLALRDYQKKVGKPTLVMVDYLQLVRVPGKERFDEISEVSRSLIALAKEFDCPVLAISQLSRKVEERRDKRPILSDLRESGQIEQDASVIMFLYRDSLLQRGFSASWDSRMQRRQAPLRGGGDRKAYLYGSILSLCRFC